MSQCPDTRPPGGAVEQPDRVMTVDEDTGSLLLPKTYVTRHGRLVLFADDPLVMGVDAVSYYQQAAVEYDALVSRRLQDTFNGNLLYLAASILAFGDDVCDVQLALDVAISK